MASEIPINGIFLIFFPFFWILSLRLEQALGSQKSKRLTYQLNTYSSLLVLTPTCSSNCIPGILENMG